MSNKRYDLSWSDEGGGERGGVDFGPSADASGEELNARLMYVTSARYGNDWNGIVHRHSFAEIFLILEGRGRFLIGGEQVEVRRNDLIIVNPMEEHAEYSTEAAPMAYTALAVEGLRFSWRDGELSAYPYLLLNEVSQQIQSYVQLLLVEVCTTRQGREAICQSLLNILLVLIRGHRRVQISSTAVKGISGKCTSAREYLDNHFAEPVTLDGLAAAMHQSKYYLAHAFSAAFGVSPMRYLVERRLEEGKHLLSGTNYSIGEISVMTGFSSASLFSQTFKRVTGMTPNEYRRLSEHSRGQKEGEP